MTVTGSVVGIVASLVLLEPIASRKSGTSEKKTQAGAHLAKQWLLWSSVVRSLMNGLLNQHIQPFLNLALPRIRLKTSQRSPEK